MQKQIALDYFAAFSRKDIPALRSFFSDEVSLRDWEGSAQGIENVLLANARIFGNVETIQVDPMALFVDGFTVAAELLITIDQHEKIMVLDVLEFTPQRKIRAIRAYKG